ncbi:MAG: energy transducer TonB [Gammaproteobacteria bacterium]|nr:energy transducer TonB [Gammaproteobacteria bacterium]MDH3466053.1 energy transducer TonB [Gammaproteobacteria bacterium]
MRPTLVGFAFSLLLHTGLVIAVLWLARSPVQSDGLRPLNISINVFKTLESKNDEAVGSLPNSTPEPTVHQSVVSETETPSNAPSEPVEDVALEPAPQIVPELEVETLPTDPFEPVEQLVEEPTSEIVSDREIETLLDTRPELTEKPIAESTPEEAPATEAEPLSVVTSQPTEEKGTKPTSPRQTVQENTQEDHKRLVVQQELNKATLHHTIASTEAHADAPNADEKSDIENNDDLQRYQSSVRERIEKAKFYPRKAKRLRREGAVSVQFSIAENGQLAELQVSDSSNVPELDRAALEAVKKSSPFPPLPAHFPNDRWPFDVTLIYELN